MGNSMVLRARNFSKLPSQPHEHAFHSFDITTRDNRIYQRAFYLRRLFYLVIQVPPRQTFLLIAIHTLATLDRSINFH